MIWGGGKSSDDSEQGVKNSRVPTKTGLKYRDNLLSKAFLRNKVGLIEPPRVCTYLLAYTMPCSKFTGRFPFGLQTLFRYHPDRKFSASRKRCVYYVSIGLREVPSGLCAGTNTMCRFLIESEAPSNSDILLFFFGGLTADSIS